MPQIDPASILKQAKSLYQKGEHRQLLRFFEAQEHALRNHDQKSTLLFIVGTSLHKHHDYPKAILYLQKAIDLNPKNHQIWYYLGLSYWKLKLLDKCLSCYQKAAALAPEESAYHLNLGMILRELNRKDQATGCYETLLSLSPHSSRYMRNKMATVTYQSTNHPDHDFMLRFLNDPTAHADDKMHANFGLCKLYMDCGMYSQAQACAIEGNKLRAKIFPFSKRTFDDHFNRVMSVFRDERFDLEGHASTRPLFIVGLSRSGKSLLEGLLAQHPHVTAKHECCFLGFMMQDFVNLHHCQNFYPEALAKLKDDRLQSFAQTFYSYLCYGVGSEQQYIIDTTPQNMENLGLLKLMFPHAKFIYCQREPLDNYVKIFLKYYVRGNSYANDMQDIAFYDRKVQALMQFWQNVCDIDIHHVSYEAMVTSPETVLKQACDFLNLEGIKFDTQQVHSQELNLSEHFEQLTSQVQAKVPKLRGG